MNSVKLNKKHLFSLLITVVLLFSFNISAFASPWSPTISFYLQPGNGYYVNSSGQKVETNITYSYSNGYTTYKFNDDVSRPFVKILDFGLNVTDLTPDNSYDFSFDFYTNDYGVINAVFTLWVYDPYTGETASRVLYDKESIGGPDKISVSGTINYFGEFSHCEIALVAVLKQTGNFDLTHDFHFSISDVTFQWNSPLAGGHYDGDDLPDGELDSSDLESIEGQLPSLNSEDLSHILNQSDISGFIQGMDFTRYLWERIMSTFNFNVLLIFSLSLGLALYVIGRKVGGH